MRYDNEYDPRYDSRYESRRESRFWPYLRSRSGETWLFFVAGLFLGGFFF